MHDPTDRASVRLDRLPDTVLERRSRLRTEGRLERAPVERLGEGRGTSSHVIAPSLAGCSRPVVSMTWSTPTRGPGGLYTAAPCDNDRAAARHALAASSTNWNWERPPKLTRYGRPAAAAIIATVGFDVMTWSRPGP